MTPHDKHQKDHLGGPQQLATKSAQHDLPGVGHAVHVWIPQLELPDDIAGIGRQDAEAHDEDDGTRG